MNTQIKYRLLITTLRSIAKKEVYHIFRNPIVFTLALIFPIFEFLLLGYVLDINIKHVDTVVYDLAKTQESKRLIERFVNSDVFSISYVNSDEELRSSITRNKAKVGIKIPVDYSQHLLNGTTANILVLVDGSNASLTNTVVNVAQGITLQESVKILLGNANQSDTQIQMRPSVLFNPATRSANFFLPGLIVYQLPSITIVLLSISIAGERERGTMDQINVTPFSMPGLLLGKIIPYMIVAIAQLLELILVTRFLFQVPMNGSIWVLLVFSIPFLICDTGLGIIVSSKANTTMEAGQIASLFRALPFYFSGYIFPLESAHPAFQLASKFVPHSYYMDIMRGVFLRGAGFQELLPSAIILSLMSVVIFFFAFRLYRKKE